MMKVLRKFPKWAIIALAAALVIIMASTFVQHAATKGRVDERKRQIRERQSIVLQENLQAAESKLD